MRKSGILVIKKRTHSNRPAVEECSFIKEGSLVLSYEADQA